MSKRGQYEVLISGTGPVGTALAISLHQAGLRVALIQPKAADGAALTAAIDSRVYALAPDTLTQLDALGTLEAIRARWQPYQDMHVFENQSAIHFRAADEGWPMLGAIVEHQVLMHALNQVAQACGVQRHIGNVIETSLDATERIVMLEHDTLRCALLVIAEGARSTLRDSLGFVVDVTPYQQHALGALVTPATPAATAWQRYVDGAAIALLPVHGGQYSLVYSAPSAAVERLQSISEDALLQELNQLFAATAGPLTAVSQRVSAPLQRHLARRYVGPRSVLVGDSAHGIHPMAGQGLNLGLRDVACLAESLRGKTLAEVGIQSALRRYERTRRSENALAVHGVDRIAQLFAAAPGPLREARQIGLRLLNQTPSIKSLFARIAAGRLDRPFGDGL